MTVAVLKPVLRQYIVRLSFIMQQNRRPIPDPSTLGEMTNYISSDIIQPAISYYTLLANY